MVRLDLKCLFVTVDRCVYLTLLIQGVPHISIGVGIIGFDLNRLFVTVDSCIWITSGFEHGSSKIGNLSRPNLKFRNRCIVSNKLVYHSFFLNGIIHIRLGSAGIGINREGLGIGFNRLVKITVIFKSSAVV